MTRTDYFSNRTHLSNSGMSEIAQYIDGKPSPNPENFRIGNLVDALVLEPERCLHHMRIVYDLDYIYTAEEWQKGLKMRDAVLARFRHELGICEKQKSVFAPIEITYGDQTFTINGRCLWDFWHPKYSGDLKTTDATTQAQVLEAIGRLDIDRSRAWYMDLTGTDVDHLIFVSKVNYKVFYHRIERGDAIYLSGLEKYSRLAFHASLYGLAK
jgi:hypothetical protein